MTLSCTELFDRANRQITQKRAETYGKPLDDFHRVALIKEAVADCPNPEIRHALEMIGVKMARLVHTPDHIDTIVDISGYARTMVMVLDAQNGKRPVKNKKPTKNTASHDGLRGGSTRKISIGHAASIRKLAANYGMSWRMAEEVSVIHKCSAQTVMNVINYAGVYASDRPVVGASNSDGSPATEVCTT